MEVLNITKAAIFKSFLTQNYFILWQCFLIFFMGTDNLGITQKYELRVPFKLHKSSTKIS